MFTVTRRVSFEVALFIMIEKFGLAWVPLALPNSGQRMGGVVLISRLLDGLVISLWIHADPAASSAKIRLS
jgi:hypothetical protein